MRNIKFRAKRTDTKNWVYGHYLTAPLTVENFGVGFITTRDQKRIDCIADSNGVLFEIDIKTLGQFTGLLDKDGKEIFEGDIIKIVKNDNNKTFIGEAAFREGCFDFVGPISSGCFDFAGPISDNLICAIEEVVNNKWVNIAEVIGKVFDNPELLISESTKKIIDSSVKNIKDSKPIDNRWLSETEI
jgi:uncharacterized phage protein (TIGR01671 family)